MRLPLSSARALAILLAVAWLVPGTAQVIIRNAGGAVFISGNGVSDPEKAEPDPAGSHLIEFFDGRRLHGTLESVDLSRGELTWRRTDASTPLTIHTTQVSRLSFVPLPPAQNSANVSIPGIPGLEPVPAPTAKNDKVHATVKFVGGDWLVAEVSSILDNKIRLQLGDGSPLTVDRAQADWIYFSKSAAPECYDGPASFAGWVSGGGWTYRDGALRASTPSQIARNFASLPDQVVYDFEVDQGNLMTAFNLTLHGRVGQGWSGEPGMIQCMLRASTLTLYSNAGGRFKNEQVDLTKVFGASLDGRRKTGKNNPVRFRVFEDFTGGRLAIFINDQKAGEWNVDKGESGKNRGGFSFQPTIWNSSSEQSLAKIRVEPWDGRLPVEGAKGEEEGDRLALTDGTTMNGKLIDLASGTVRMRTGNATGETSLSQIKMLHLAHRDNPAGATPEAIARVRLIQGGEFDAASVNWRDGKLQIRARFGSEFPIPVGALAELSFLQTPPALATAEDLLVFQNGDRLKGKLEIAEEDQKVRWRTDESAKPVEFDLAHVAGVRGGWSDDAHKGRIDSVARFRNGDWLAGRFLTLDKDQLVLDTPEAGQLTISRALVRTLYFSKDGTLPISDGAADDRDWLRGLDLTNIPATSTNRKPPANTANLWKSFDGTFSLLSADGIEGMASRAGGIHIGRQLPTLPPLVEVSFDVTGQRGQILFSAQLFTEAGNPGYFMQLHSQGLYIYDLNPGTRGRGGIIPQQVQFEGKLKPDARQRHVQLFANRDTGQLTILVDGVEVTHFGGKSGSPPRQLGRGLMISPQLNLPCTFSNIWIGPWNGRIPGKTPAADSSQDTAILNNGDEAPGTVEVATPSVMKLTSDVGPLELPLDRVTMIDFGGAPVERTLGARLHLAGSGCLTVGSYHVENDTVTCRSDMVGDLRLPLHAIQELVFSPARPPRDPKERE